MGNYFGGVVGKTTEFYASYMSLTLCVRKIFSDNF